MLQDPGDELNTKMTVENNMSISEQYYMVTAVTDEFPRTTMTNTETMESTAMTCRVCATATQHFIPIFMGEGLVHQLCDKIQKYLPIEVKETDKLPLQMCFHCTTTLLAWHEISEGCLNAQQRLHQMQAQLEEKQSFYNSHTLETVDTATEAILQDEFVEQAVLEISQEFETDVIETKGGMEISDQILDLVPTVSPEIGESILTEIICEETSQVLSPLNVMPCTPTETTKVETEAFNSDELNRHDVRHEVENLYCEHCDHSTINRNDLVLHIVEKHPGLINKKLKKHEYEIVKKARVVVDDKTCYYCSECRKVLFSPYTFLLHTRIHTGERPHACHLCNKSFRVKHGLVKHVNNTHKKIKNHPCDICDKKFATKKNVEDHRRIHTGERPYMCNVCGKLFTHKSSLFSHNRSHSDSFPFLCDYCQKGFRTKAIVAVHIKTHTGEKPYACDICERNFRTKFEIRSHRCGKPAKIERTKEQLMEIENSKTLVGKVTHFKCPDCPRLSRTTYNFLKHRSSHTNEKPWTCNICDKGFKSDFAMKRHSKNVHHGVKEFQCEICGRMLATKIARDEHRNVHTNERPYLCDICPKSFKQRSSLTIHKHFHSKDISLPCDKCDKCFVRKGDLKKHRLIHTRSVKSQKTKANKKS